MSLSASIAQNISHSVAQAISQVGMNGGVVPVFDQDIISESSIMITSESGIDIIEE